MALNVLKYQVLQTAGRSALYFCNSSQGEPVTEAVKGLGHTSIYVFFGANIH